MSVLIKNMEMPKNCHECPLLYVTSICDGSMPCPLVTVPPHGRLIDADALEKDIDKYIGGEESRSRFHHWVQVQRTVIPESEEART